MCKYKYVFKILLIHEIVLNLLYYTMNAMYELGQVSVTWYTIVSYVCIFMYILYWINDNLYILGSCNYDGSIEK
jgi:fatty-acid desaturase